MRILICGGGVIGTSIAWFLAKRGAEPVVIERTGVANAASGKSGGFLALDWCDGTALAPLARRSFALHASLAEEIEDDWGYRCVDTYSGYAGATAARGRAPAWLSDDFAVTQRLGSTETTAQVHPGRFTAAMMRAAEAKGATLCLGRVTGLTRQDRRVTGVSRSADSDPRCTSWTRGPKAQQRTGMPVHGVGQPLRRNVSSNATAASAASSGMAAR